MVRGFLRLTRNELRRSKLRRIKDPCGDDGRTQQAAAGNEPSVIQERKGRFYQLRAKKYGYSKDVLEEAYKYLVEALAQDGFVDDAALQAAIDEAKSLAKVIKPTHLADVVDYSFLRAAVKK